MGRGKQRLVYFEEEPGRASGAAWCSGGLDPSTVAANASAETRHNTSKSTGAATATTHAGPNTIHANQQGMSGMRANAGNRNFSAEERLTGANGNPNFAAEERMSRRPGNRIFATEERMTGTRSYAGDRIYAGRDRFNGTRAFSENRT